MRILILGVNFSPELTGIGKYTGEMARFLSDRGHELRVVTTPPYYPQWRVSPGHIWWAYRQEKSDGILVTRCPLWVPRSPTGWKRILHLTSFALSSIPAVMLQAPWRPQLVLAIAPAILSAPGAMVVAKITGAVSWLHIQDYELDAAMSLDMLPIGVRLQPLMEGIERAILKRFSRVSSISQAMVNRAADKGVPRHRLVLLPNWVDIDEIHPQGSHRGAFGIPDNKLIALYSGNLGAKQGLSTLIATARRLEAIPEIHFVICGEGAMKAEIERLAAKAPNVQFLPLQPAEKLNALLSRADVHLLPQRAEASDLMMPSKLLGMMASGRPSVIAAPPRSELARIAVEGGVLVPPGDPKAMADAIVWLARNPDERKRLGASARAYILKSRNRDAVLAAFEAELKALVASASPRRSSHASTLSHH